ncbi:MAG: antirestriction protein ArdA [Pseudomonadota bacterium]
MSLPTTTAPLVAAATPTPEGFTDDPDTGGPRILVRCLAAYNSGRLHGVMVDATLGEDHIWEKVRAMLAASPEPGAEEWAIHDYEGFEGATLSEYASFESVCALAEFITEQGELGAKLYRHFGDDLEQARAAFDDYAGEYRSAADFAEQLHDDFGTDIPESLQYYIDWEALARDMALNVEIIVFQTEFDAVHVFWQR